MSKIHDEFFHCVLNSGWKWEARTLGQLLVPSSLCVTEGHLVHPSAFCEAPKPSGTREGSIKDRSTTMERWLMAIPSSLILAIQEQKS